MLMSAAAVVIGYLRVKEERKKRYSIYLKYWYTLSTYHTCPKIEIVYSITC